MKKCCEDSQATRTQMENFKRELRELQSTLIECQYCSSKFLVQNAIQGTKILQPMHVKPILDHFRSLGPVVEVEGHWSIDENWKVLVTISIWIAAEVWGDRCQIYGVEMNVMQMFPDVEFDFSCISKGTT